MANAFAGLATPLSQSGMDQVLDVLGIGAPDMWAVLAVETRGCGFLPDRRPLILFERHVFHRRTGGRYDVAHPNVSSAKPGGYLGGGREYGRLEEAMALDRSAALNSASWGIGQIMGFNYRAAGFESIDEMVTACTDSEDSQLVATANFLRSLRLHEALARRDWAAFARGYNGPDYRRNSYDSRLHSAFEAFSRGPLPDLAIRQTQVLLMFLGIDAGAVDGIVGKRTRSGIRQFRERAGLPDGDDIDVLFLETLTAAAARGAAAGPV
jgi:hypothetical protein